MIAFFGLAAEIWPLRVSAEIPSNEITASDVGFPATVMVPLMMPLFIASAPCNSAASKSNRRANSRTCRRVIFLLPVLDSRENPHSENRRPLLRPVFLQHPKSHATLSTDSSRREYHQ